jgi:hypothetical protein
MDFLASFQFIPLLSQLLFFGVPLESSHAMIPCHLSRWPDSSVFINPLNHLTQKMQALNYNTMLEVDLNLNCLRFLQPDGVSCGACVLLVAETIASGGTEPTDSLTPPQLQVARDRIFDYYLFIYIFFFE